MKLLLAAAGAFVLAGVVTVVVVIGRSSDGTTPASAAGPFRGSEAPPDIAMPNFALSDQDGRLVRSEDLRGRVVVLTFLDTECREACPIIAGEISRAWRLLTPSERAGSIAIAISTDPRDDTPASIRAFLQRHRARGTIRYLVGPVPVMLDVWRRFQILSSFESGEADTHSAPVRVYSRDLLWLATQHAGADLSPRNLAHDIRVALGRR